MLIEVCRQKEHSTALARLTSHILCSCCRVGAGAGEDPFAKVENLIPSPISRLQTKDSPRSRHMPNVTKSCRISTAMRHQQYVVSAVEVETDQCQQDASKVSEDDNANENQFQEVRRDVARQLQHSNLQAGGSSLDKVAPQQCARRSRPEDKQVARGQGARNRGTGRDEHPERKGGWNSRSEATRAPRAGFAIDSAKNLIQDENEVPSDQKPLTYTAKQLEDARFTSEPQR